MKHILTVILCLVGFVSFAQTQYGFRAKANIYSETRGTSPDTMKWTISFLLQDDMSYYIGDSISVGDVIYSATDYGCVSLRIDTINSNSGGVVNVDVFDLNNYAQTTLGIAGIFTTTPNKNLPLLPQGLPEQIISCIVTDLAIKLDEESGGGVVDLSYTASPTNGTVVASGDDAIIPLGDGTNAGLLSPADFNKLALYPSTPLWQRTGTRLLPATLTDNTGFGIDPSTTAKVVVRGNGTSTGKIVLFEDSAGTDRFFVNDNGEVYINNTSNGGQIQLGNSNNSPNRIYFGGLAGSVGLINYLSSIFRLGQQSFPDAFYFDMSGGYPCLNAGGYTGTPNAFFRARRASGNVNLNNAAFNYFSAEASMSYTNSGSYDVTQFRAVSSITQSGVNASLTGTNYGFLFGSNINLASIDSSLFKQSFVGYGYAPVITANNDRTIPFRGFYVNPNISGGLTLFEAYSTNNSVGLAYVSTGTAPSYHRGQLVIGGGATTPTTFDTNTALDVNGFMNVNFIRSQGTAPSIAAQAAAGTGATASITSAESTNMAGSFTLTTGSASVAVGNWVEITFTTPLVNPPVIQLSANSTASTVGGDNAANMPVSYVVIGSAGNYTGFAIRIPNDPTLLVTTRFDFSYFVMTKQP